MFPDLLKNAEKYARGAIVHYLKKQPRVLVSDTTLRDGEQAPGAALSWKQKRIIAEQLAALGVDSIEAGFPASGENDCRAVREIAHAVKGPLITALSRCTKSDIEVTARCFEGVRRWGISLFLGTSPLLRQYSLKKTQDDICRTVRETVSYACSATAHVAFGAEDATRTEPEFLFRVYEEAIRAGALVIGLTDTVGWYLPHQVSHIIREIRRRVKNFNKAILAVHFHNDLGLAVANTLAAIEEGATVVQCTVNGIGERAGNASLEEVVLALKTRHDHFKKETGIHTRRLTAVSRRVAEETGIGVPPQKPIVGANVFATEAGIHQAAILNNSMTYQIIDPAQVGQPDTRLVLGRHSGKHALRYRLARSGIMPSGGDNDVFLERFYRRFKKFAETKKEIHDEDLRVIAQQVTGEIRYEEKGA